jgi:hypothetical protein
MSLWNSIHGLFTSARQQLTEHTVTAGHTDRGGDSVAGRSEQHYFRVKLAQMFLRRESAFFTTYYPLAYSTVSALFNGEPHEVSNVADASRLTLQQDRRGDYVAKNFVLSPLMPFGGGNVRIAASLHAVQGRHDLAALADTLGGFAELLIVPELAAAIRIARPLAAGLQKAFADAGASAHLVYANSFVGQGSVPGSATYLHDGYIAVIRAPRGEVNVADLHVVSDELRTGPSLQEAVPFVDHDFMLIHIEVREDRDDFNQLRAIREPFDAALNAVQLGDQAQADALYRATIAAVLRSPELTKADRRRVSAALKADFEEARETIGVRSVTRSIARYDLQSRVRQHPMTTSDALRRGEPTFAELMPEVRRR